MNCPTCGAPIDPALILRERQREIASRERPGSRKKPGRNPYGRKGAPKKQPKSQSRGCDCHLRERQVCDICQAGKGDGKDNIAPQ